MESPQKKAPKNIILLIGDGMGLSQVSAAQFYKEGASNFEEFPVIGLIKTSASDKLITDSAAGATAFACGIKTYNGAIGVNADTISMPTILEDLSKRGYSSGVISTSSITHATPASFYAHVDARGKAEKIASYLPKSEVDFFAGGGLQYFNKRKDSINLFEELKNQGFDIDTTGLNPLSPEKKQAYLLAQNGMPKMLDGRGDFLPDATQLALQSLSANEAGFFLMVEGSQIDWGGHANEADYVVTELLDFEKTMGVALDFAKSNDETLIIVTADHETGGYTLASDDNNYNKIKDTFSTDGHSATMVPVFSYGPGSEEFGGIYENTEIYHKIMELLKN